MAEVYHILPEVTTGKMRTPSKSQQFTAKFCAPVHRKYTIYGHPWVFLRESVFSVGRDPCVPPKNAYPPYGVRRSYRADRVLHPYKAEQEPRETGRRTPRAFVPLRSTAGRRPLRNDREWDGGTSYPKGICSAALHGRTPSPTGCMGGTANGGEKCLHLRR